MKIKAQNLMETSLMLCLVAIIAVSVITMYGKEQNGFIEGITQKIGTASETAGTISNSSSIPATAHSMTPRPPAP